MAEKFRKAIEGVAKKGFCTQKLLERGEGFPLNFYKVIHSHHLPPSLQSAESTDTRLGETLEIAMDKLERDLLQDALKSTKGNMAKASKLLGLTERKMGLRVSKYNIEPKQFR